MNRPAADDIARERIARVFRYLAELQRARTPPARRLEDYDWRLRFSELPQVPAVRIGRRPSPEAIRERPEDPGGDDFILKVRRPRETPCPPPPAELQDWLVPGWQRLDGTVEVVPARNRPGPDGDTITERFDSDGERVRALEAWTARRQAWREAERPVRQAMELFRRLFDLWGRLERESEKLELVLGEGVLLWERPDGPVHHPLLLQKLQLEFDPQLPEFTIRETDREPELYTPLLHAIGVDGAALASCRAQLEQGGYHPLGGDDTTGFLEALVHRLWSDGEVLRDGTPRKPESPQLMRAPVIYLGPRALGFAVAIDAYLERLKTTAELPPALVRVVGIEDRPGVEQTGAEQPGEGRADSSQEAADPEIDLLFTKPANPEQEQIARRLASTGCVLVQGPPGTGKTHTIGNLIGHLLAQGKSILVTSHTAKALRAVRENVVPALRPLCVSVLDRDEESRRELEAAVSGIVARLSRADTAALASEAAGLAEQRRRLRARMEAVERELRQARRDEYADIVVAGEGVTPAIAARRVAAGKGAADWIPGPVEAGAALPLTVGQLRELYELNRRISAEDERDLSGTLPALDAVPTDEQFRALAAEVRRLEALNLRADREVWVRDDQEPESLREMLEAAQEAVRPIAESEPWFLKAAIAGQRGGDDRAVWDDLIEKVEGTCREIASLQALILEVGPRLDWDRPLADQVRISAEILAYLTSGRTLGRLARLWHREWREFLEHAAVDSGRPETVQHFEALNALIRVEILRTRLRERWSRQMGPLGVPIPDTLAGRPEEWCRQFLPRLRAALNWHATTWHACEERFEANGLDWQKVLGRVHLEPPPGGELLPLELLRIAHTVRRVLPPLVETQTNRLALQGIRRQRESWSAALAGIPEAHDPGGVVRRLREAVLRWDGDAYAEAWQRLAELHRQRAPLARRNELLAVLEQAAPGWAEALRSRRPPHDGADLPGDPYAAWQHRQWAQELERRAARDLDRLQHDLSDLTSRLHDVTAEYVDRLTWAAQLRRTGLAQQQALVGWLTLMRRIGKGTGIRAPALKAAARRQLSACRSAVPVWIMPLARVVESYDFRTTSFDVVILDEASQSDVLGLLAFALGKEVIVVGDSEQVSPEAVGQAAEQVGALIETYLPGIPNKELYDGRTSVYDLARMSFGGVIRLVEHFRCVPDIIQFSNHLCYQGEIKPLREASGVRLKPHVIAHRVQGGDYVGRLNRAEALEVASLLVAASQLPEYAGATMGVVSLVGEEQAREIDRIVREHMPETEYTRRRIVCGNAAQFQGDERDVMFLSVVDTAEGGPLPIRTEDRFRQRFNVAASRARDQMWVVHSLNPDTDLKPDDLRLRLIRHAEDPSALVRMLERAEGRAESEFERQVLARLAAAGFRVKAQWPVGAYRIDLVVEGANGRVAIECDGDRYHPIETLDRDFERQRVLERLGWRFIRLRGSQFFLDPDGTIARVVARLREMGIEPIGPDAPPAHDDTELRLRIIRRAEELRRQWAGEVDPGPDTGPEPGGTREAGPAEAPGAEAGQSVSPELDLRRATERPESVVEGFRALEDRRPGPAPAGRAPAPRETTHGSEERRGPAGLASGGHLPAQATTRPIDRQSPAGLAPDVHPRLGTSQTGASPRPDHALAPPPGVPGGRVRLIPFPGRAQTGPHPDCP